MGYLQEMDYLEQGIGLRGFGQRDPLVEYKTEAFRAFQMLVDTMYEDYLRTVMHAEFKNPEVARARIEGERNPALAGARMSGPAEVDGDTGSSTIQRQAAQQAATAGAGRAAGCLRQRRRDRSHVSQGPERRPVRQRGPQRPVPVRQRQEVQELPWQEPLMAAEANADAVLAELEALSARLTEVEAYLHIEEARGRVTSFEEASAAPGFWDDVEAARAHMAELAQVKGDVGLVDRARERLSDARAALELADEMGEDGSEFVDEAAAAAEELTRAIDEMELSSWFTGEFDHGSAILSIKPGQGGLEAQDWTFMLFKMYMKYFARRGWKVTVNDCPAAEVIGIDRATITVEGKDAFGMLRAEAGVHRLVRISPTDAKKRRQTTFAGVEVIPGAARRHRESRSRPTTSAWTCTMRAAPAARASTPTPPCASRTSPRASWSPAKTSAARSRTRPRACRPEGPPVRA